MDTLKEAAERFIYRVAAEIANTAIELAPTRTRNLRNDIKVYKIAPLKFEIGNSLLAPYAPYVHFGTGIYGPKKRKIVPKKAKALKIPINGKVIFRKSVKGQKPNPYFKKAVDIYLKHGFNQAAEEFKVELTDSIAHQLKNDLKNIKIEIKS